MEVTTKENTYKIIKDDKSINVEILNLDRKLIFQKTFIRNSKLNIEHLVQDLAYSTDYNGGVDLEVFVVLQIISKVSGKSNKELSIQKYAVQYMKAIKEKHHISKFFDEN